MLFEILFLVRRGENNICENLGMDIFCCYCCCVELIFIGSDRLELGFFI